MERKIPAILFDSECSVCSKSKAFIELFDLNKIFYFYSIRDSNTFKLFSLVDPEEAHATIHLVSDKETILRGEEAVRYIFSRLPFFNRFSFAINSATGKLLSSLVYHRVNEYRKSKLEACAPCRNSK